MDTSQDKKYFCIHRGHNASCAVMVGGKIVAAIGEDRFSGVKNDAGFPYHAIKWCLEFTKTKLNEFDVIAYSSNYFPSVYTKSRHRVNFSIPDYREYYETESKRKSDKEFNLAYLKNLRDSPKFNTRESYYDFSFLTDEVMMDNVLDKKLFQKEQIDYLVRTYGVSENKIRFLDHHTCHAYYAYFASPFREKKCAILTLDGGGDGKKQSLWIAENDKFSLVTESNENDLAKIYKLVTLILGLRPDNDEYKVMGLAPYAKEKRVRDLLPIFESLLKIDGMIIRHKNMPIDLWKYLRSELTDIRFDEVAGAVQLFFENCLAELVTNICTQLKCDRFVFSGGMALNVKTNKVLSELPCVKDFYICASGGDETLCIGGCYFLNSETLSQPLNSLYLGYDVSEDLKTFDFSIYDNIFRIQRNILPQEIATLLADGKIIARMSGRSEHGARALGNRSILAHPGIIGTKDDLNKLIKKRDFWMPFALTILDEYSDQIIVNPKGIETPWMSIAFKIREEMYHKIFNGIHPYDLTVRPQVLKRSDNPNYYEIVDEFRKLTGIPAILNTSFNLHESPMCLRISDGIEAFMKSGLKYLLIDNILLEKGA